MGVTQPSKKSAVKEVPSVYRSGFCSLRSHENTKLFSPSGVALKACPVGGRFDMGREYGGIAECTCECHQMSRQMEQLSGVKFPVLNPRREGAPLSKLGLLSPGGVGTGHANGVGTVDPDRPTVVVASGARFAVTPTGRAARGQLEEQVRYAINTQIKAAGEDMIKILGLTPGVIATMIDKDDPPSTGAIYSVLKRWENNVFVELGESPFRFLCMTDRGKRELGK